MPMIDRMIDLALAPRYALPPSIHRVAYMSGPMLMPMLMIEMCHE
jgi:hypothetical protein